VQKLPEVLSLRQVQEALHLSRASVGRLISEGELAVIQLRPHRVGVEREELSRFIAARRVRRGPSDDDGRREPAIVTTLAEDGGGVDAA
jgi:hypothetical protein